MWEQRDEKQANAGSRAVTIRRGPLRKYAVLPDHWIGSDRQVGATEGTGVCLSCGQTRLAMSPQIVAHISSIG